MHTYLAPPYTYVTYKTKKTKRTHKRPLDEVERAIHHFPAFLSSYAYILKELQGVDPHVLIYLENMICRLFLVFPNMISKHRKKNYVALTRLFVVLYTKGAIFQTMLEKIGVCCVCDGCSDIHSALHIRLRL